jgi:hypothetical protein
VMGPSARAAGQATRVSTTVCGESVLPDWGTTQP